MIEPEPVLNNSEISQLISTMNTPGFKVILKILKSTVDSFFIPFINKQVDDEKGILAAHNQLKTAAQLQEGFVQRLNIVRNDFGMSKDQEEVEPDITHNVIDIGEQSEEIV